jgi:hypothetical protein
MLVNASNNIEKGQEHKKYICNCGKAYLHDSSYYRHKIACINYNQIDIIDNGDMNINNDNDNSNKITTKIIIDQFKNMFLEQQKQYAKEKAELIEIIKTTNNSNNQIINGNHNTIQNTFNIQLFLNNKCSKAVSIQDFAKQLKVTIDDLSLLKNNEQKAITNIIVKNLKDYTEFERPVHKHEKKWYIKDKQEGWDKEGQPNGDKIVKNIKMGVSQKAGSIFIKNNPDFLTNDKKDCLYTETMSVAMNNITEKTTTKILKNIEKLCVI